MRKLVFLALVILFISVFRPLAEAQQSIHRRRIGFLAAGNPPRPSAPLSDIFKAFHKGLGELGYIEGKNVFIEYRYVKGQRERSQKLAEELVSLRVNVIVATSTPAIVAARQVTSKIPIVMISVPDPVARFVDTLAQPGGNITGVSSVAAELSGKLLELITEAVPEASLVGVLWHPLTPAEPLVETEMAARALKRRLQVVEVLSPNDLGAAMVTLGKQRVGAVVVLPAFLFARNERQIADLAIKNRLATGFWRPQFAQAGGLMAYGPRLSNLWQRAGVLVGKILNGAKPTDLPVEQPTKFDLVINLKTAKALGLKIPAHLLMEADKVIE